MRLWLCVASANGFIAVAMGALAAHGLEGQPWRSARQWVEIGAEYQMAHALALLALAVLRGRAEGPARRWLAVAGWSFVFGMVFFSGTLFAMGLGGLTGLGAVVPVGGLAFLIGWAALFYAGLRYLAAPAKHAQPGDAKRDDPPGKREI
jgi:uncharacterized membrane protein YgdD (TMEM256/DUF423 family)